MAKLDSDSDRPREVGLLVDTATSWGRSIIAGVGAYSQSRGGWVLRFEQDRHTRTPHLPQGWHGDGIIARITGSRQLEALQGIVVPIINISAASPQGRDLPTVQIDSRQIARLAADHLQSQGLRHFAYLGLKDRAYSRERRQFFREAVGDAAESFASYDLPATIRTEKQVWQRRAGLIEWLSEQPRPLGLSAWSDELARLAIEACQLARLRVPEDVAILGNDNDELICNLTSPPMSSIELGTERTGYHAAELLDQAMSSSTPPEPKLHLIDPIGVVDRQSTNLLAIDDTAVATVLGFIRDQFHRPIQVSDALEKIDISRRSLERRFHAVVGRTPAAEIRRVRLEHARRLLLETDLTVGDISRRCGFEYAEHLIATFGKAYGNPPQRYREKARPHRLAAGNA